MDLQQVHERQITRLMLRLHAMNQVNVQLTRWRIAVFCATLILAVVGFNIAPIAGYAVLLIGAAIFSVLVYYHRRVDHMTTQFSILQRLKYESLARQTIQWDALPIHTPTSHPEHPFAHDIDIVGEHSLHRLLDTTVSQGGSMRLREWLLSQRPDQQVISHRQRLISELIPKTLFRDRLTLAVRTIGQHKRWDGERVLAWLRANSTTTVSGVIVSALWIWAAINAALVLLHLLNLIPPVWIITISGYWLVMGGVRRGIGDLFSVGMSLQSELERLNAAFSSLENYRYTPDSALADLCRPLTQDRPSKQLRTTRRIVTGISLSHNIMLWFMLNTVIPWDMTFAWLLQRTQHSLLAKLPTWLNTLYEVEASNALAHFAYLNPHYTFPSLTPETPLQAHAIGHPMIPHSERVTNDFALNALGEVVIITGSNMSGKSSFLRTLGVNLCLAYAGGVVCADQLHIGLFRLFTCIRVNDSVVDGISYFYAEVRRLKALLNALHEPDTLPLFFLIDEIFRGTNNLERLTGSRAYIKALANGQGIGLISTHDLELTRLADEIANISNYHFREDVRDGKMIFDYLLRKGASPTTNALKIMALEGLPID